MVGGTYMMKVSTSAVVIVIVAAERFGPYVLTVPAVPLIHGCAVARINKRHASVAVFTVGTVCFIVTVVVF